MCSLHVEAIRQKHNHYNSIAFRKGSGCTALNQIICWDIDWLFVSDVCKAAGLVPKRNKHKFWGKVIDCLKFIMMTAEWTSMYGHCAGQLFPGYKGTLFA